jgi:hypothetical protein
LWGFGLPFSSSFYYFFGEECSSFFSFQTYFTPSLFVHLLHSTSSLPLDTLYHVAFSFAFLAMLRISNLAPSSSSSFDPLCHFRRGDVTLSSSSLSIHLRWSKPFSGITSQPS